MIIDNLYVRLANLVETPNCDTFGDDYDKIIWRDSRPLPSVEELKLVDITNGIPPSPTEKRAIDMMAGVEFSGVMCSAHKEDQWGISSIEPWLLSGRDVVFEFKNGNKLLLTAGNIEAFKAVWVPFRSSFF